MNPSPISIFSPNKIILFTSSSTYLIQIQTTKTESMASTSTQKPSRLQRKKPASLDINPPSYSGWNVAIPLLSPLITSPISTVSCFKNQQQIAAENENKASSSSSDSVVFKKWQHPAICHDSTPFVPSFFVSV
ncbi:uncharacterized protein At4g14450, chloroplastic-like [Mercurialis annua]|uniref:uncharacterized protein At4g14450, chloroplastic-like n=1 Tax=Mercurialis annua TaxID=3986 RepID=UPI00215E981A|nr:uncharacterized protein At4g14450, chloroplastic-like [Mercurialis annua]